MNNDEAHNLAFRILETFQGPPGHVWEEELADLDAGRAGTAYAQLRRNHKARWLSIADFIERYRMLNVDDASTRGPDCLLCGGDGWVRARDHVVTTKAGDTMRYTQCEPCQACENGTRRAASTVWRLRNAHKAGTP